MRRTRIGNRLRIYTARGLKAGRHQDQGHARLLEAFARQAVTVHRLHGMDESWTYTLPAEYQG